MIEHFIHSGQAILFSVFSIYIFFDRLVFASFGSSLYRIEEREEGEEYLVKIDWKLGYIGEGFSSMGNYRFRLSDMMPNAWFYKLRDMSRIRNHGGSLPSNRKLPAPPSSAGTHRPRIPHPSYSFHQVDQETTEARRFYSSPVNPKASDIPFPDPTSSKRAIRKSIYHPSPTNVPSSVAAISQFPALNWICDCPANSPSSFGSRADEFKGDSAVDSESLDGTGSGSGSSSCLISSSADIIIDMKKKKTSSSTIDGKLDGFESFFEVELPPITTRPFKSHHATPGGANSRKRRIIRNPEDVEEAQGSVSKRTAKEGNSTKRSHSHRESNVAPPIRKCATGYAGANPPRMTDWKTQGPAGRKKASLGGGGSSGSISRRRRRRRQSFLQSFAIVKSSFDPQKDFRDSMLEMIAEHDIRSSKDLEELLTCYLSLNSDEYHSHIIWAFQQILTDMY